MSARLLLIVLAVISAIIAIILFAIYASNVANNGKDLGSGLIFLAASLGLFELGVVVGDRVAP